MSNLNITKLINQISRYVKNSTGDITDRHSAVSSIVGAVIGTHLTVPVAKVVNPRMHYQSESYPTASNWLNQINESYDLDLDLALECAYLTWLDRYKVVHAPIINAAFILKRLCQTEPSVNSSFDNKRLHAISNFVSENESGELNAILLELITQLKED